MPELTLEEAREQALKALQGLRKAERELGWHSRRIAMLDFLPANDLLEIELDWRRKTTEIEGSGNKGR